ncbi:hypothetical protein BB560_004735 [Smittium megazygosporum]|uniref:C2H2-type domain-containing protein n=1 Tax=Smittium megazygosporum TaxID=133381 RepID=A0A2T9Z8D8_9FUNG|nr:hypothetical protein BB560_004735 [Smittium megazygosporum]
MSATCKKRKLSTEAEFPLKDYYSDDKDLDSFLSDIESFSEYEPDYSLQLDSDSDSEAKNYISLSKHSQDSKSKPLNTLKNKHGLGNPRKIIKLDTSTPDTNSLSSAPISTSDKHVLNLSETKNTIDSSDTTHENTAIDHKDNINIPVILIPLKSKSESCIPKLEPNLTNLSNSLSNEQLVSKEYSCSFCDKVYRKPSKLQEHIRSHTGERPFKCTFPGCDKTFIRQSHLSVHNRTHYSDLKNKYKCNFENCSAAFNTNQHLKRHLTIHSNSNPYKKDAMNLLANTNLYTFIPHSRTHSIVQRYMCGYKNCNLKFPKLVDLKAHIKDAHKQSSIQCPECNKKFSRHDVLSEHMKTHDSDRELIHCPYPDCSRVYLRESSLNIHIRSFHSNIKPFKCSEPGCEMHFARKHLLARHKKVHANKIKSRSKKDILEQIYNGFISPNEIYNLETNDISIKSACSPDSSVENSKKNFRLPFQNGSNLIENQDSTCSQSTATINQTIKENKINRIDQNDSNLHNSSTPILESNISDENTFTQSVDQKRQNIDHLKQQLDFFLGRDYQNPELSNRHYRCTTKGCVFQFKREYDLQRHIKKYHSN